MAALYLTKDTETPAATSIPRPAARREKDTPSCHIRRTNIHPRRNTIRTGSSCSPRTKVSRPARRTNGLISPASKGRRQIAMSGAPRLILPSTGQHHILMPESLYIRPSRDSRRVPCILTQSSHAPATEEATSRHPPVTRPPALHRIPCPSFSVSLYKILPPSTEGHGKLLLMRRLGNSEVRVAPFSLALYILGPSTCTIHTTPINFFKHLRTCNGSKIQLGTKLAVTPLIPSRVIPIAMTSIAPRSPGPTWPCPGTGQSRPDNRLLRWHLIHRSLRSYTARFTKEVASRPRHIPRLRLLTPRNPGGTRHHRTPIIPGRLTAGRKKTRSPFPRCPTRRGQTSTLGTPPLSPTGTHSFG